MSSPFNTPILFIIFNKPESSARVFETIRAAAPLRLYIASDGARPNRPDDDERVAACRELINKVDWPCEVKTLFREENLGCGRNISGALNWFFEQEEMGIIMEDDCLPDASFYPYCEELLLRYKDEPRVMHISGVNFQGGRRWADADYFFNTIQHCWGWATWRRAWQLYDFNMSDFDTFKKSAQVKNISNKAQIRQWWITFLENAIAKGNFTYWSVQWSYCIWKNGGVCINPNVNLVSNIGYGPDATHTTWEDFMSNNPTEPIHLPLRHPSRIRIERKSEERFYTQYGVYKPITLNERISQLIDLANPKKNRYTVAAYQRLKPWLMKIGLRKF
jgi:glycosyltransferase involved in cell wall biosynthesis